MYASDIDTIIKFLLTYLLYLCIVAVLKIRTLRLTIHVFERMVGNQGPVVGRVVIANPGLNLDPCSNLFGSKSFL